MLHIVATLLDAKLLDLAALDRSPFAWAVDLAPWSHWRLTVSQYILAVPAQPCPHRLHRL
eukprot:4061179-Prorocentrum_lima.AAC.1